MPARRFDLTLVGHVTRDVQGTGRWRPGGTVAFAARAAVDLGLRVAVVTTAESLDGFEDVFHGAEVFFRGSPVTTTFENVYDGDVRHQRRTARSDTLTVEDTPTDAFDTRAVLLGPVAEEVPVAWGRAFPADALVFACAQGWLREVDASGRVRPLDGPRAPLNEMHGLFLSREDLAGGGGAALPGDAVLSVAKEWVRGRSAFVCVTDGGAGSTVLRGDGEPDLAVPAFPVRVPIDPTGAGDTYAVAFCAKLLETHVGGTTPLPTTANLRHAAHFASAAASYAVEQVGIGRLSRAAVDARSVALDAQTSQQNASRA